MADVWCHDDNKKDIMVKYHDSQKFAQMCNTYTEHMYCVSIPTNKTNIFLLFNFLDKQAVPTDNNEQIELVKVCNYVGLKIMSVVMRKIYQSISVTHGLHLDTIHKYAKSKKDNIYDYKFCVYVLENLNGLLQYQNIMNKIHARNPVHDVMNNQAIMSRVQGFYEHL